MNITKQNLVESGIKTLTFNANIMKDADGNHIADVMDEAFKTQALPGDGFQLVDGKRKTEAQFYVQNDGWFVRVEYAYRTDGTKVIQKADLMFSILDKDLLTLAKADPKFASGEVYTFAVANFPDPVAAQVNAQADAPVNSAKENRAAKQAAKKAEKEKKIADREAAKNSATETAQPATTEPDDAFFATIVPAPTPVPAPVPAPAPAPTRSVATPSPAVNSAPSAPVASERIVVMTPVNPAPQTPPIATPTITSRETVVTAETAGMLGVPVGTKFTSYSTTARARVGDLTINFAFPAGFTPVSARGTNHEMLSVEGSGPEYTIQLRAEIPADQKGKFQSYSVMTREDKVVRVGVLIMDGVATSDEPATVDNAGVLGALQNDPTLDSSLGQTSLSADMTSGIGGLIGNRGTQIGSGGLGARGSGLGGGGTAEGLGGLGTKGRGSGASGYGSGGGNFGTKGPAGVNPEASTSDSAYEYLLPQVYEMRNTKFLPILKRYFLSSKINVTGAAAITVGPDGKVTEVSVELEPNNTACEAELTAVIQKTKFSIKASGSSNETESSIMGTSTVIQLPITFTVSSNG